MNIGEKVSGDDSLAFQTAKAAHEGQQEQALTEGRYPHPCPVCVVTPRTIKHC
jgi:hypothetical protein